MNLDLEEYQIIFKIAEYTAKKYYKYYKSTFKANNYEIEDLVQEAKKEVVETINKYKNQYDFTRIFKLCNQKIGWRMKDLLDLCKKHITVFHYEQENIIDEKTELLYPVSIDEDRISSRKNNNIKFKFEELHIILSDMEYDIIYDIFHNGMTHKTLGKKYKCSRQQITKKYQQAIKKVKSYLNIN